MKKLISSSIAALTLAAASHAAIIDFDLIGRSGVGMRFDNENPSSASGSGTGGELLSGITYDDVSNLLILNVGWGLGNGFTNLTGNVTAAHIHAAANSLFTTNGGVIVSLDGATPGFNNNATIGGWTNTQVTLTATQETQLLNGQLYLNAHTSSNPGGEIRGNLVPAPVPEPASFGLVALGALTLLRRSRRA